MTIINKASEAEGMPFSRYEKEYRAHRILYVRHDGIFLARDPFQPNFGKWHRIDGD